jgi:hypothetical protein
MAELSAEQVALRRTCERMRLALSFLVDDEADGNLKVDASLQLLASLRSISVFSDAASHTGVIPEACNIALQRACEGLEDLVPELLRDEVQNTTPSQMMRLHLEFTGDSPFDAWSSLRGRPGFAPEFVDMMYLVSIGYDSPAIANLYGVAPKTAQRWLSKNGLGKRKREQVGEAELRSLIEALSVGVRANWGWRMVLGHLLEKGVVVTQARVQNVLRELNPVAHETRRMMVLAERRAYRSRGPNAVWHIDGNHKLAPWGIYIHGGIDGGTKFVLYLAATDCNTSEAACRPFMAACERHQGCSRVRMDKGTENKGIAEYQLQVRGRNRGSVLLGPSYRNQPIERLWRDVRRAVLEYFRVIFRHIEKVDRSWRDHEVIDRHCLRAVFLPLVQASLDSFISAWNHHNIRNAGVPAHRYEPCCRWDTLGDEDWNALKDLGYTRVPESISELTGIFGQETSQRRHQAADPVRLSQVFGFGPSEAAQVLAATQARFGGALHLGSSSSQMIEFYKCYRQLVSSMSSHLSWPAVE